FFSNPANGIYVTWIPKYVSSENARRSRANGLRNFVWIDIKRTAINVHEYRITPLPNNTASGCHIRKWGGDDLPFESKALQSQLQCNRTVAHVDKIIHS